MSAETRVYSAEEVAELQVSEVRLVLRGLLAGFTQARDQRAALPPSADPVRAAERRGELHALNIAIAAVKRRMR